MGEDDKRFSARHAVTFPVVCDDGGAYIDGAVLDLSLGGCFVHTHSLLDVGTEVTVSPLGEAVEKVLEWQAKVVRRVEAETPEQPAGMGLQFTRMKRSAFEAIQQMFATMPKTTDASLRTLPPKQDVDERTLQIARLRIRARRR